MINYWIDSSELRNGYDPLNVVSPDPESFCEVGSLCIVTLQICFSFIGIIIHGLTDDA